MPTVNTGEVNLYYEEHGRGEPVVVFIHGNLGCTDWMELVWPLLPEDIRVIAVEWRGCGRSDKPAPQPDYSNYSIVQHAQDMIAAIRNLGVSPCHLCGHSTGGIIATHMVCMAPERFGKVLVLDPVGPMGLDFSLEQREVFAQMRADRDAAARVLATAMPTLFESESFASGSMPAFGRTATAAQRELFERLVDKTRLLSDGIWFGTPYHLAREWHAATLRARQEEIRHEFLVLWGEMDHWIPREHMEEMAKRMPNCRLVTVPGVGHAMNVEQPEIFARYFSEFFGGRRAVAGNPPSVG